VYLLLSDGFLSDGAVYTIEGNYKRGTSQRQNTKKNWTSEIKSVTL